VRSEAVPSSQFWRQPSEALLVRVQSSRSGLTALQAEQRLATFGPNAVLETPHRRFLVKIAKRFIEPLTAILLFAAAVSGLSGDRVSFLIITTVIFLSIFIDVVQEQKAEISADALKRSVAIRSDVRRDGQVVSIPVEQIVPGDVVELRAGDLVPADGIILESRDAHVSEVLMTGEPYPVEKQSAPCNAEVPAEATNALFAGTSIVSGTAVMLVILTGRKSGFGAIAAALAGLEPPSAFERGIRRLGMMILRLAVFFVLFVLAAHLTFGRVALDSFLFAVAIAVGLTPELLPMVMTVTLSRGALRMATKNVIVKRLSAIHDLGAMDVLCTDKTGTLTEARIKLVGHFGVDGKASAHVLTLAGVNSCFESGIRSPLDDAIRESCKTLNLKDWIRMDEVPFDFDRRSLSVLAQHNGERILIMKGAPEAVLERSIALETPDGKVEPLDDVTRSALAKLRDEKAAQGFRLLAVAWRKMPDECEKAGTADENNLTLAGFCSFFDPPKATALSALTRLANAGIRVKVLSGDDEAVVRYVVSLLGIPIAGLMTGTEIAGLPDVALEARVEDVDLFARITPDQKMRIVRALQARGHIVGFVGDGVNDAPAIRAAEVGLSVDGATDVARSAADIILLDKDLGILADGVEEGRRTFANILKYVRMGTSSNFGNMLSMAVASLALPFLPLLPAQILLNNLLYDLSEIGIPFDSVDTNDIARPRAWNMDDILRFTLIMGALSSLFDIMIFVILVCVFRVDPELFRTAWFVESTATQILVIFVIRTRMHCLRSRPNWVLVVTSLGALAAALVIALSPVGGLFGFVPLPLSIIGVIVVLAITYLAAAESAKKFA
jgi:Mg2+-importing ATPase